MSESDKEIIDMIASTAVAIINSTDDETVTEMSAWIADKAISLLDVTDL